METVINIGSMYQETDDIYSLDQRQEVEPRSMKSRKLKRYTFMSADLKEQANCRGHTGLSKPSNDGLPFTYPASRRVHCRVIH